VIKLFGQELGTGAQAAIRVFNFLVFAGGLFLLLKGALSAAFRARTKEVEERLAQAEQDRLEGEAQLRNLETRMAGLQAELDGILSKAEADAEAEKARILEAARAEAAQITAQAQADITAHQRAAEAELRALVVELAVEGAEQRLRAQLQGASASTAVDRAIASVGASTGGLR
jgi:F-type H+-transporting ATPase subunit b